MGTGERDVTVPVRETLKDQFGLVTAAIHCAAVPDESLREVPVEHKRLAASLSCPRGVEDRAVDHGISIFRDG